MSHSISIDSPLGALTVVEKNGAVTALRSGGTAAARETPLLCAVRDQLLAYFEGRLKRFDLPVAPAGSPFERAVWDAMCAIPYGETRTYGTLAAALANTPRAVGQACGANPIPIIIPCHRVLGASGQMVGYSGFHGTTTKEFLLALEGAIAPPLPFEVVGR